MAGTEIVLTTRGQIHFHLGSLPKGRTAAPAALRRHQGVSLAQGGWVLTKPAPDALTQGAGQGKEHGEKLSPPKQEQEVPQGVCSALREPGERPGGEVNIVRRGGASPAGLLPSRGGPGQLSPCGMLEKARSRARSWAGLRDCKPACRLWWGTEHSPAWLCYPHIPWVTSTGTSPSPCLVLRAELPLHFCPMLSCPEQVFTHPSPLPCP